MDEKKVEEQQKKGKMYPVQITVTGFVAFDPGQTVVHLSAVEMGSFKGVPAEVQDKIARTASVLERALLNTLLEKLPPPTTGEAALAGMVESQCDCTFWPTGPGCGEFSAEPPVHVVVVSPAANAPKTH